MIERLERIEKTQRESFELFRDISLSMKKSHEFLASMTKVNEAVEDTLLNVLLAIRQNEFLHAWYPAQGGHQEQKVVGSHPAIEERRNRKYEHIRGELAGNKGDDDEG